MTGPVSYVIYVGSVCRQMSLVNLRVVSSKRSGHIWGFDTICKLLIRNSGLKLCPEIGRFPGCVFRSFYHFNGPAPRNPQVSRPGSGRAKHFIAVGESELTGGVRFG